MALHLYPAAEAVLIPLFVADVALAAWAWRLRREPGAEEAGLMPVWALAAALLFCLVSMGFYGGEWARAWPVCGGLLVGLALAWLWEGRPVRPRAGDWGPLASGLAALAVGALLAPDAVAFANWGIALVLGWGASRLSVLWAKDEALAEARDGTGLAFAFTALAAGAAAWGEKLAPGQHLGAPLTLGLASTVALALAVAFAVERRGGGSLGGQLAGGALFLLGAAAWMTLYAQPWPLLVGIWGGAAFGLAAGAIAFAGRAAGAPALLAPAVGSEPAEAAGPDAVAPPSDAAPRSADAGPVEATGAVDPWGAVAWAALVGASLVVDNRLGGIVGVGLGGLGFALGALSGRADALRPLLAGSLAIFAARVFLQLFLDRTALTTYGVDLTHPYATAGLVLGALSLVGGWAIARLVRGDAWLSGGWALAVVSAPVWFGYMLHVEPLAAWIAGGLAALFVLLVPQPAALASRATAATLVLTFSAVCLWAAPFLVPGMNASRSSRLIAFGLLALIALGGLARYAWRFGRRAPKAA